MSGDQWPLFLYADYCYDPEDPWNGLFRSALLVSVSTVYISLQPPYSLSTGIQACLHLPEFSGQRA